MKTGQNEFDLKTHGEEALEKQVGVHQELREIRTKLEEVSNNLMDQWEKLIGDDRTLIGMVINRLEAGLEAITDGIDILIGEKTNYKISSIGEIEMHTKKKEAVKFLGPLDLANKIIAKKYKNAKSWKGDLDDKKAQTDWTKRRDINKLLDDDMPQFEEWEVDDPEVVDVMQEMDAVTNEVYDLVESDPVLYEEVLRIAHSYLGSELDPSIAEAHTRELIAEMIINTNAVSEFISEEELNKVDWAELTDRFISDYYNKEGL